MSIRPMALTLCLALSAVTASADTITTMPTSGLNWQTTPEGVAFAALHGDRFEEAYIAMVRLPGGLVSPAHSKTADMFGLIVDGVMTHVPAGTDPMAGEALAAGAYYRIPAGLPHVSSCVSQEPCVTFLYQDGAFDFLPVTQ